MLSAGIIDPKKVTIRKCSFGCWKLQQNAHIEIEESAAGV
jgi:hypothetical protein